MKKKQRYKVTGQPAIMHSSIDVRIDERMIGHLHSFEKKQVIASVQ